MAEEQRDALVQSFVTELQDTQIDAIARLFNVDRVKLYRDAVAAYLDSEPTSLEELGRLRAEMFANIPLTVRFPDLSDLPTKRIDFYLTRAERYRLDSRAAHENLSRSGAVERALVLYIADQFQRPELRDF